MRPSRVQQHQYGGSGSPYRPMWCGYRSRHPMHRRLAMVHRQPATVRRRPDMAHRRRAGTVAMVMVVRLRRRLHPEAILGPCRHLLPVSSAGPSGGMRHAPIVGRAMACRRRDRVIGPWSSRRVAAPYPTRIRLPATATNRLGPPPRPMTSRSAVVRVPGMAMPVARGMARGMDSTIHWHPIRTAPMRAPMATGPGPAVSEPHCHTGPARPAAYGPGHGDPDVLPGSSNSQLMTEFAVTNVNSLERYSLRSQLPEQCRGYLVDTEVLVSIDDLNERVLI